MGAIFSAIKTEYVVVAEQDHPLGSAYSFPKLLVCVLSGQWLNIGSSPTVGFISQIILSCRVVCVLSGQWLNVGSSLQWEPFFGNEKRVCCGGTHYLCRSNYHIRPYNVRGKITRSLDSQEKKSRY